MFPQASCTMLIKAMPTDRAGPNEYVPLFSYSKSNVYRHTDKAGLIADTPPRAAR